jgi:hypothetical protein
MGGFYGSVQIRGEDRESVRSALEPLAKKKRRFLLGPPLDGWIGVYPDGAGQDFGVARDLARRLKGELIAMLVHDDDVFAYEYYRDGRRIDQYNSIPDYFGGEVSEKERQRLSGRPETFAHLARDPAQFAAVRERLAAQASQPDVFVSGLLQEFADALGIRNALTSYEYLQEHEDTDDVEGWDQFLHIPDLSREKAQKRAADAAIEEEKHRLIEQGLLLAERGGLTGWATPHPWLCPSPDGRGFLVAWSSHAEPKEESRPLERHGPPWSAGPAATPWAIGPHVYGPELSPSGRYLAVAHAAGDWKATLWDLQENRLIADVPQVRAVHCVGFLADESAMVSVSSHAEDGRVILTPIDGGTERTIALPHAKLAAAHPSGSALVLVDELGRLLVADIGSGRILRTRYVGGRYVPSVIEQQMQRQVQAQMASIDFDALEQRIRQQQAAMLKMFEQAGTPPGSDSVETLEATLERQIEEQFRQMREQFARGGSFPGQGAPERGSESVFRVRFDPTGEWLAVGTMAGARVYPWREVRDGDGDLARPALAVDIADTTVASGHGPTSNSGYVYDLEYDPDRGRFLFAGLDGRVRFLDSGSGRSGVLLEPPDRPPIHRMALSRDRSTLALIAAPGMFDQGRNRRGPIVQFWDYQKITRECPL